MPVGGAAPMPVTGGWPGVLQTGEVGHCLGPCLSQSGPRHGAVALVRQRCGNPSSTAPADLPIGLAPAGSISAPPIAPFIIGALPPAGRGGPGMWPVVGGPAGGSGNGAPPAAPPPIIIPACGGGACDRWAMARIDAGQRA